MALAAFGIAGPAKAAGPAGQPTREEFETLKRELAEQRALIMQFIKMEQERYEFLLKLVQPNAAGGGPSSPPIEVRPATTSAAPAAAKSAPSATPPRLATVTGKVSVKGGNPGPIFVYVDNLQAPPVRGRKIQIEQKGKQFIPQAIAVQRGTVVSFPNLDPVYHNVFSPSPTQAFDLGTYRAGDAVRQVTLRTPGVVEVYCNIHAKMRSSILVVPNALVVRAGADGRFKLEHVPVGSRRLVAWAPAAKPALVTVDVTGNGAEVAIEIAVEAPQAHNNKFGQPYGSYSD